MSAYWVARARIDDPVRYKKYTDQVPAIIKKHGGNVLARGGRERERQVSVIGCCARFELDRAGKMGDRLIDLSFGVQS